MDSLISIDTALLLLMLHHKN